jgi:glycosyltransferase involved in cell wall biosynthesis
VYVRRLYEALEASGEVEVVRAANPRRRPPAGGGLGSVRNALRDEWWTSVELPRRARAAGAELIHHPLPAHAYGSQLAQVVTVHDLAFERVPRDFALAFRVYARYAHRAAARQAAAVIAVSRTTAEDLRELWGVEGERVFVAPHGPGHALRVGVPAVAGEPYFLYVGDAEPRKDLPTLLGAYERYRAGGGRRGLVLAGAARATGPGIRVEPSPSSERLGILYNGATALVHPSRYEGFGLTVLEAMSVGTPVIAAACPAVVELTDGTARMFEPGDVAALAAALAAPPPAASGARRRAAQFSWATSAERHLAAYSWALSRS